PGRRLSAFEDRSARRPPTGRAAARRPGTPLRRLGETRERRSAGRRPTGGAGVVSRNQDGTPVGTSSRCSGWNGAAWGRRLLLVALDRLLGPFRRRVRVEAEFLERASLTEEVPATVERDLHVVQTSTVGLGRRSCSLAVPELVLLGDKLLDALVNPCVVHAETIRRRDLATHDGAVAARPTRPRPSDAIRSVREQPLAIRRELTAREPRVCLVRHGRRPLDPRAVRERGLVDRVGAPVRAGGPIARADRDDDARRRARPDDGVLGTRRAVDEVPLPEWPLLALDQKERLACDHEEVLLVGLPVVHRHRLARREDGDVDPELREVGRVAFGILELAEP